MSGKKGEEQKNNHHRTTPLDGCIYTFWGSEEGSERELARENTQRIPRRYNENTSVHEIPQLVSWVLTDIPRIVDDVDRDADHLWSKSH